MWWCLPLIALAQLPSSKVVVIDVSAPDAVYEDVSRGLAEQVVAALNGAGIQALRIDENELPEEGCRLGPCLGVVAKSRKALVVVIVDAVELDKKGKTGVSVAAMAGFNGMPLTAKRYTTTPDAKPTPELKAFVADLTKKLTLPDGGRM